MLSSRKRKSLILLKLNLSLLVTSQKFKMHHVVILKRQTSVENKNFSGNNDRICSGEVEKIRNNMVIG